MSCPFFEPLSPVLEPQFLHGRLPLIQEHEGMCHASGAGVFASGPACNHGYARGQCERFPAAEPSIALRYSVLRRHGSELEFLCIAEENHAPVRSRRLHFSFDLNRLKEMDVDACLAAQAVAFCRSYLRIVAPTHNDTQAQSTPTAEHV
jgi:hypothetical protein